MLEKIGTLPAALVADQFVLADDSGLEVDHSGSSGRPLRSLMAALDTGLPGTAKTKLIIAA